MNSPTMEEMEQSMRAALRVFGPGPSTGEAGGWTDEVVVNQHKLVHMGLNYVDCNATLLLEAWEQVKKTVNLCAMKVLDPKEHRAETLLLMILQQATYHGYTPLMMKTPAESQQI